MSEWHDNRRHAKHERRAQKRAEAQARQAAHDQRTTEEQIDLLRERGAFDCDEAWRLRALRALSDDDPKPKLKKVHTKS